MKRHETVSVFTSHAEPAELAYFPTHSLQCEFVLLTWKDARGSIHHFDLVCGSHEERRSGVRVDAEGEVEVQLSIPQLRRIVDEGSRILAERDAAVEAAS